MTWLILIALGMFPWVIAVDRVLRRQSPARLAKTAARREFDEALRRMLAAEPEGMTGIGIAAPSTPPQPKVVLDMQERAPVAAPQFAPDPQPVAQATARTITEENEMPEPIRQIQAQGRDLPAGLSIIEGFVPGDDLLELTLDEDEVAAAEAAGVRLDVRVERASTGQGSLVTVGGTPLAFIRGNAQVTSRDVILRVEKVA